MALLLVLPASVALIQNIGIEIQRAQNKHKFRAIVYTFMALINVGISIVLCQLYGAIGSAVGTAISLVLANGIVMNVYYHCRCNINVLVFWKGVLRVSVGLIIPVIVGFLICEYVVFSNVWIYLMFIVLYSAVYIGSMWLFGMNATEKALFIKPLRKIVRCHNDRDKT